MQRPVAAGGTRTRREGSVRGRFVDPRMPIGSDMPPSRRTRVMVVDDHEGVRTAVGRLLSDLDDIVLVGAAADGQGALDLCHETRPDVVLMDLSMPGIDGIEATRRIASDWPATQIVVYTACQGEEMRMALAAGAVGYVLKHEPGEAVLDAIRAAARGSLM